MLGQNRSLQEKVSLKGLQGDIYMRMYDIIQRKRDNKELSGEEIRFFVEEYTAGNIPDYQAAALAMAIFSME